MLMVRTRRSEVIRVVRLRFLRMVSRVGWLVNCLVSFLLLVKGFRLVRS